MHSRTKVASVIATGVMLAGLGSASALASTPITSQAPITAEVGSTIGFGIPPAGFDFGQVALGSVAEVDQTLTVVGNDSYGLTVYDSHTGATDPNADMGSNGSADLPANTLWLAMATAPNGASNDAVWSVNGCQTSAGYTGTSLPSSGNVTPGDLSPQTGCTQAIGVLVPIDGNSVSGASEGAPVGGTDTFGLRWLLSVPSGTAPGQYASTLVYSLTGS